MKLFASCGLMSLMCSAMLHRALHAVYVSLYDVFNHKNLGSLLLTVSKSLSWLKAPGDPGLFDLGLEGSRISCPQNLPPSHLFERFCIPGDLQPKAVPYGFVLL
jgi:hypothetical protein